MRRQLLCKPSVINLEESGTSDIEEIYDQPPLPRFPQQTYQFHLLTPVKFKAVAPKKAVISGGTVGPAAQRSTELKEETKRVERMVGLRKSGIVCNRVKLQRRDQLCSICLSPLKDQERIGKLSCSHAFCFQCILKSSNFSNKCPYCRAQFRFIDDGAHLIPVEEPAVQEEDPYDEPCYICGRNDDFDRLLECDFCESAYCHTYCDERLQSESLPSGEWFCRSCEEMEGEYDSEGL